MAIAAVLLGNAVAGQQPVPIDWTRPIRSALDATAVGPGLLTRGEQHELQSLYRSEGYVPLWMDAAGCLRASATEAISAIKAAPQDGLEPDDYLAERLDREAAMFGSAAVAPLDDAARFDVTLTAAVMRYFRDLHLGRVDPRGVGFRMNAPADQHDFGGIVRRAVVEDRITETVAELRPQLAQYRLLRDALVRYRALARDPAFRAALPPIPAVRRPEDCQWADAIRRRLVAFGDLRAPQPPAFGSSCRLDAIVEGIRRFQMRHGLVSDGVIGKATHAALSVPASWRVRQIELSLERLRWLPHLGDDRLMVVNIPMFQLWAWDSIRPSGNPSFGMSVIVGRAVGTQTPVFVDEMTEVIFRPYWNVPRSILRTEILPIVRRDPGYLARQDMEIVSGPGDGPTVVEATADAIERLRIGVLRLRQRPGPRNSLGLIKFQFPNEDNVYMHGTPAQSLFARSRRDFSHGCVRVEDPVKLAEWVLRDRPEWNRSRIEATTAGSSTVHVPLPRPVQLILFYTTAAVMPEDGTVRFADDIYHHDVRLDRALEQRAAPYRSDGEVSVTGARSAAVSYLARID